MLSRLKRSLIHSTRQPCFLNDQAWSSCLCSKLSRQTPSVGAAKCDLNSGNDLRTKAKNIKKLAFKGCTSW